MIAKITAHLNSDGTKHRTSVREVSVIVKGNPVKLIKIGTAEVKFNYNVENGFVRLYNTLEYGTSDLTNINPNVNENSYICSFNINEKFDLSNIDRIRIDNGSIEEENFRLYPYNYSPSNSYPNTGEWPSPVFIKTALTIKNGNRLVIGTKGSIIKFYNNSTYSGDPIYLKEVDGNVTAVYNLLPKTTYYYRVLDSSDNILFSGSFTTEGKTRFIRLPLVHNVRDCGGWKTIDGSKRFKYGLIFRGALFDPFYSNPTSETLTKVVNELINLNATKTVDLRGVDYTNIVKTAFNNKIVLYLIGEDNDIDFYNIYSDATDLPKFFNAVLVIVNVLKSNKSAYIHCQLGRDRTGILVAILEALCNISENGIIKDYELTTAGALATYRSTFRSTWLSFKNGYSDSTYPTILSKILRWFIERYNDLNDNTYRITDSNGNYITTGQAALLFIQDLLSEYVPLKNMTIGIIGDSYSAYLTWKPVLSEAYHYTGEFPCTKETEPRDNVKSPTQMWWYKVASNLGMVPETLLSLAAWSGTFVTDYLYLHKQLKGSAITERDKLSVTFTQDARPASSPQRIKHLSNKFGGVAPDIIVCEIGMNDARYLVADGTEVPNKKYIVLNNSLGERDLFITPAYIVSYYKHMLDNIINLYPDTKIFCMTPVNVSSAYVTNFTTWKSSLITLLNDYPLITLIDVSDAYVESGSINTVKYTIHDNTHPNVAGNTKIANIVSAAISEYYTNLQPEQLPQEDEVYITQINDDSFTGSPTINGDVFTWPLKVTLSDGTVTTYANYRSNHSNYGDATSLITGDYANAPNEGYIDSNGNLTYDLSRSNYVLDSTYLGTVTLPCLTNSSNTVTKEFSKIQKCASSSTPFDSYISSKYDFTTVTGWNLSYHMSSSSNPDKGKILVSTWPQVELEDISAAYCTIAIPTDCIIRVNHLTSAEAPGNHIGVVNTSTALTRTGVQSDANIFTNDNTDAYSRGKSYTKTNNFKSITVARGQKAYLRNTTTKTYSYLITFARDSNCIIEVGTLKTSS